MSTCRKHGNKYEFIIKRKKILGKPYTVRFDDRDEGQAWCDHLEGLLDAGIVPDFLADHIGRQEKPLIQTLSDLIIEYKTSVVIKPEDINLLDRISGSDGALLLSGVDYDWSESWVSVLKRVHTLAPSTVRKYVGALARCIDWGVRKNLIRVNPLRILPKGYSTYTSQDIAEAGIQKTDQERDRRLSADEEKSIYTVFDGGGCVDVERPLLLKYKPALVCLFELALNSAMRLREMYTLTLDQVDLDKKTIFLDKTKNGDKRQVPLSSDAMASIKVYLNSVNDGDKGMREFSHGNGLLFPWWNADSGKLSLKKTTAKLSKQYSAIFNRGGLVDFNFHDLRHEATSRLFEKTNLSDLQIAKITGHKDPRILMRYANLRGSDLADQLW